MINFYHKNTLIEKMDTQQNLNILVLFFNYLILKLN